MNIMKQNNKQQKKIVLQKKLDNLLGCLKTKVAQPKQQKRTQLLLEFLQKIKNTYIIFSLQNRTNIK